MTVFRIYARIESLNVVPPENTLIFSIFWIDENLAIHLLDVSYKRVTMPPPTQKYVREGWQQVGTDQKLSIT